MFGDERLQLGDELTVSSELEVGIDPGLECCELAFLEPGDLDLRPRLEAQIGERPAAKERERLAQPRSCLLRRSPRRRADECVEAIDIDLARRKRELVTATPRDDPAVPKRSAEPRDVDLNALDRGRRRLPAPYVVDQTVRRDRPATREQQQSEERPLLLSTERDLPTVFLDLDRAENPELHPAPRRRFSTVAWFRSGSTEPFCLALAATSALFSRSTSVCSHALERLVDGLGRSRGCSRRAQSGRARGRGDEATAPRARSRAARRQGRRPPLSVG